jgi:hypothetical protein
MSREIASTWLKLTRKKLSQEFSHSLDPCGPLRTGAFLPTSTRATVNHRQLVQQAQLAAKSVEARVGSNVLSERANI